MLEEGGEKPRLLEEEMTKLLGKFRVDPKRVNQVTHHDDMQSLEDSGGEVGKFSNNKVYVNGQLEEKRDEAMLITRGLGLSRSRQRAFEKILNNDESGVVICWVLLNKGDRPTLEDFVSFCIKTRSK